MKKHDQRYEQYLLMDAVVALNGVRDLVTRFKETHCNEIEWEGPDAIDCARQVLLHILELSEGEYGM